MTHVVIMYTTNHIKFSCIIRHKVLAQLNRILTYSLTVVTPFQLSGRIYVLITSFTSQCHKCLFHIRIIIWPPDYSAKLRFGSLRANSLEYMFMNYKLLFISKFFTNIYFDINWFAIRRHNGFWDNIRVHHISCQLYYKMIKNWSKSTLN